MPAMKERAAQERNICGLCGFFSDRFSFLARWFERIFVFAFARPGAQKFNDIMLSLVLRAKGYNNCCSFSTTGEDIFFKKLADQKPRYCIDVGANIGSYSHRLLEGTQAIVMAFEPLPLAFEELRALSDHYHGRFIPVNKGLGETEAVLDLHFGEDNIGLASFEPSSMNIGYVAKSNRKKIKAEITSLDKFITEDKSDFNFLEVDLLKIDTEGYEYNVLLGAKSFLLKTPPKFIQIEYNIHQMYTRNTLHEFQKILRNYRPFRILPYGGGLTPIYPGNPTDNIFYFSNILFIRRDLVHGFV